MEQSQVQVQRLPTNYKQNKRNKLDTGNEFTRPMDVLFFDINIEHIPTIEFLYKQSLENLHNFLFQHVIQSFYNQYPFSVNQLIHNVSPNQTTLIPGVIIFFPLDYHVGYSSLENFLNDQDMLSLAHKQGNRNNMNSNSNSNSNSNTNRNVMKRVIRMSKNEIKPEASTLRNFAMNVIQGVKMGQELIGSMISWTYVAYEKPGHANMFILRKQQDNSYAVFMYEPHGKPKDERTPFLEHMLTFIPEFLNQMSQQQQLTVRFQWGGNASPEVGPQTLYEQHIFEETGAFGDKHKKEGLCATWSIFYYALCALNLHKNPVELGALTYDFGKFLDYSLEWESLMPNLIRQVQHPRAIQKVLLSSADYIVRLITWIPFRLVMMFASDQVNMGELPASFREVLAHVKYSFLTKPKISASNNIDFRYEDILQFRDKLVPLVNPRTVPYEYSYSENSKKALIKNFRTLYTLKAKLEQLNQEQSDPTLRKVSSYSIRKSIDKIQKEINGDLQQYIAQQVQKRQTGQKLNNQNNTNKNEKNKNNINKSIGHYIDEYVWRELNKMGPSPMENQAEFSQALINRVNRNITNKIRQSYRAKEQTLTNQQKLRMTEKIRGLEQLLSQVNVQAANQLTPNLRYLLEYQLRELDGYKDSKWKRSMIARIESQLSQPNHSRLLPETPELIHEIENGITNEISNIVLDPLEHLNNENNFT